MVTYRLADSVPPSKRGEWLATLRIIDDRERAARLEAILDQGLGGCVLRRPELAEIVEQNWLHFDAVHYRLIAWVVMPNHVHLLVEIWDRPLAAIVKSWKAYSARHINRHLDRSGSLWQEDYWDRRIRDEEHFRKALRYVEGNPARAGLVGDPGEWPFSSAHPRWPWTARDSEARYWRAHLDTPGWRQRCAKTADEPVHAPIPDV